MTGTGFQEKGGSIIRLSDIPIRVGYPILIGILIILAYHPTLTGEFILDDRPLIKNNSYIREFQSIISYLSQEDGADVQSGPGERTGYYRPLLNLTYWLDQWIWGMDGSRFRWSNLFYHFLACTLFFHLLKRMTGDDGASFWIAALFAVHPVNTEAVSWVSSRNNILVAIFGLASLLLYIEPGKRNAGNRSLSLLFFAGALLSKEFGLALLPIFLLWTLMFDGESWKISDGVRNHIPFAIVICAYLLIRYSVTCIHASSAGDEPLWRRAFFAPYLALANTGLVIFPFNLHSFIVRYPPSIFSWQGFSGILFIFLLVFLFWREKDRPLFRFGLLSFLCSLFLVLHIVALPSPSLVSMRWLYFPMLFLLLAVSPYVAALLKTSRVLTVALLCLVVYFGFLSHLLNRNLWHDEKTFFMQEVLHFKNHYYSSGLAEILYGERDYIGAEEHYAIALREGHATSGDLINYGSLLIDQGRPEAALTIMEGALRHRMSHEERAEFHNNMGMACFHLNRPAEAIAHLKKAVVYSPRRTLFWANLAGAYGIGGDYPGSVDAFRTGLEMEPDSSLLRKGLALTFLNMQNYASALITLEKIPLGKMDKEAVALLEQIRAGLILEAGELLPPGSSIPAEVVPGLP
jgi:Tfp pilus assembly protein PilF